MMMPSSNFLSVALFLQLFLRLQVSLLRFSFGTLKMRRPISAGKWQLEGNESKDSANL